jgi:hypothetical protein
MVEINETNYCDQKPVTMEFSFLEHDLLNQVLNHVLDAYDFTGYSEIFDMPDDSPVKRKYNMILELKERSHVLWMHRFDNPPYNNNFSNN